MVEDLAAFRVTANDPHAKVRKESEEKKEEDGKHWDHFKRECAPKDGRQKP
jgi:hypothetical protein